MSHSGYLLAHVHQHGLGQSIGWIVLGWIGSIFFEFFVGWVQGICDGWVHESVMFFYQEQSYAVQAFVVYLLYQ